MTITGVGTKFYRWDGSEWKNKGQQSHDVGNKTITSFSLVESFSPFTLGSTDPDEFVPITLRSFTAKCDNQNAIISWTTATEINNDYFILEKSYDAQNFFEIARIDGAGFSNMDLSYEFVDKQLLTEINYYRLTQVDFDGTSETFHIIDAVCKSEKGEPRVIVYPNPFTGEINVFLENIEDSQIYFEIIDELGKQVFKKQHIRTGDPEQIILNLDMLAPAIYNLQTKSENHLFNNRVIKM